MRIEEDFLGKKEIEDTYYGIHTIRATENFPRTNETFDEYFIESYFQIKKACTTLNNKLGYLSNEKSKAIKKACDEKFLYEYIIVDPLSGGAGTSVNMNVNEVIANRATELLGGKLGEYIVDPLQDVNMHQSTNDTFVTAGKMAVIKNLQTLVEKVILLQNEIQKKEKEYYSVKKIARTQLMDAVPILFGQTFGAWADALSRDRWRLYKVEERVRSINLGGTAVGNGVGAPRDYILKIVDELKKVSGVKIAKAENLIDNTQNLDVFVEVHGLLKALSVNLLKISNDIRLLGSGPNTSIGEIILPKIQGGSSIMPGKINPVIPEYVIQLCYSVFAHDSMITNCTANGTLELNHLSPTIVHHTLKSFKYLINSLESLTKYIKLIKVNEKKCRENLEKSTSLLTPLIEEFGHDELSKIIKSNDYVLKDIIKEVSKTFNLTEEEVIEKIDIQNITGLGKK
ncbi:aspartate ammonia-lyase [Tepiditoga spiralis]|uniref:Aspartate ammonia-lyase n=1 Tax=Tepiditoga spiralis TaxID=2108365 RepID=A0A7G1G446_9BACT|nr:aspartate ammonia-lyase [Tepiditoga spiralis]BBE30845.1 aspartate ammonia-lyase [Tepiditoga spiralis]